VDELIQVRFLQKNIDIPAQRKNAITAIILPISPIGDHKDKRQLIFAHLQPKASHFWWPEQVT
jgi:hypothetical protein